jgi:hypothetical protein
LISSPTHISKRVGVSHFIAISTLVRADIMHAPKKVEAVSVIFDDMSLIQVSKEGRSTARDILPCRAQSNFS